MLILGIGANLATLSLIFLLKTHLLQWLFLFLLTHSLDWALEHLEPLTRTYGETYCRKRRPAAAMITWLMMIFGIAMTAGIVGMLLVPYSFELLFKIVASLTFLTLIISVVATWRIENNLENVEQKNEEKAPLFEELKVCGSTQN